MRARSIVRRVLPVALLALLAAGAAARPLLDLGRLHPDEVFQFLEPAHRLVNGYGLVAWEWEQGLRSWAMPGVLAGVLAVARWAGVTAPSHARAAVAVAMFVLHLAMLLAIRRYAARRAGATGGLAAALAIALYEPVLDFAGRTMSETFSTTFLVIGLERLDPRLPPGRTRAAVGGALLGLAFGARYGAGAALVGAGLWLVAFGGRRRLRDAALGGAASVLALGALDRVTWGGWFHAFIEYTNYNLLSGEANARFGTSEWSFYLPLLVAGSAPFLWSGLVVPRSRSLLHEPFFACGLSYLLITSAAAHKEERFLYGVLVLFAIAGAVWTLEWASARSRRATAIAACSIVLASLFHGAWWTTSFPPLAVGEIRLAPIAGAECPELAVVGGDAWSTGGYFYLGRHIPMRFVHHVSGVRDTERCVLVFSSQAARPVPPELSVRAHDHGAVLYVRAREP